MSFCAATTANGTALRWLSPLAHVDETLDSIGCANSEVNPPVQDNRMHRLQFKRNVSVNKEYWRRTNTIPRIGAHVGWFAHLHIYEENARFVLCALLMLVYIAIGAVIFKQLERENELQEKGTYVAELHDFIQQHCGSDALEEVNLIKSHHLDTLLSVSNRSRSYQTLMNDNNKMSKEQTNACVKDLTKLLRLHTALSAAGYMNARPQWDYGGSFYFAATVVSTLGYGMTTPRTMSGRLCVIAYGFIGCGACMLFFNLFMERTVTVFAIWLRKWTSYKAKRRRMREEMKERERKNLEAQSAQVDKQKMQVPRLVVNESSSDIDDGSSSFNDVQPWKPSLYKVFGLTFLLGTMWISLCAVLYSHVEQWEYYVAVYFAFVSFATIGFGDFIASQQNNDTENIAIYHVINFVCMTIGCCIIYSLIHLASVVVRQLLNVIIRAIDVEWTKVHAVLCFWRHRKKPKRYLGLGLRPPSRESKKRLSAVSETSDLTGLPNQLPDDGLISLKEFLMLNQSSLYLLQKQLISSTERDSHKAKHHSSLYEAPTISANKCGPLGILSDKFDDE